MKRKITDLDKILIYKLNKKEGWNQSQIAKFMQVAPSTISKNLKEFEYEMRDLNSKVQLQMCKHKINYLENQVNKTECIESTKPISIIQYK